MIQKENFLAHREMLMKGYQPIADTTDEESLDSDNLITRTQALRNISEWLFANQQPLMGQNKQKWREQLLEVIEWNIKKMR